MPSPFRFGLTLIFIVFPLLEIAVLIMAGDLIGFWPTFLILIAAATLGFFIIRQQGVSVLGRMVSAMNEGRVPLEPMFDSYVLTTAGFLLIMPGLISDVIALVLLVPPLRHLAVRWALGGFSSSARPRDTNEPPGPDRGTSRPSRPIVIEGTYERVDTDGDDKPGTPQ